MTLRLSDRKFVLTAIGALVALLVSPAAISGAAVRHGGGLARNAQSNTWVPTSPMSVARSGQTATLLPDGEVLVAGGGTATAELYDPHSGTFSSTASMSVPRTSAVAALLSDGNVLVAGGYDGNKSLDSAELYDPGTGEWTSTGSLHVPRGSATATLLPDGNVLVAGGACSGNAYGCDSGSFLSNLRSAELYDATTGTWAMTGRMHFGRDLHTATLLPDGDVLVTGGFAQCDDDFCSDLRNAELYNPGTQKWTTTGSMDVPREQQTATLLPSGLVLVAGGLNYGGFGTGARYSSAELYNPASGTWTSTPSMAQVHVGGTAVLLTNGWVLVAGGQTDSAQIYVPVPGIWVSPEPMSTVRTDQTATLLQNGHVLVTGGGGPDGQAQATSEVFLAGSGPLVSISPSSLSFGTQEVGTTGGTESYTVTNRGSAKLSVSGVTISGSHPSDFEATTNCNRAPVAPGATCTVSVRFAPTGTGLRGASVDVVDDAPASPQGVAVSGYGAGPNAWAPTGSMETERDNATATLLSDGDVLVAGGTRGLLRNGLDSAEVYDPATRTFTATGSLDVGRTLATATLLPDGDVLVAGGEGVSSADLSSAELYDPATGSWVLTTPMNDAGYGLTSTLLPSGDVLVSGVGFGDTAEVYDPAATTWTDTGPMPASPEFGTATLLADGDVLVAGGGTAAAELYDPASNDWSATGPMTVARVRATANLLPDGQVLVEGGVPPNGGAALSSAELYDPLKGTWAATGSMSIGRYGQTATLLTNGTVIVAGGCSSNCDEGPVVASTEVYSNGYWFRAAPMTTPRYQHTATLLPDGDVLVVGGDMTSCCRAIASAEVYTSTLVSVTPSSGQAGLRITVMGSGFYAGEVVLVTWDFSKVLGSVTTTDTGAFSVRVTVPASLVGAHTVRAAGKTSLASATATFLVTSSP